MSTISTETLLMLNNKERVTAQEFWDYVQQYPEARVELVNGKIEPRASVTSRNVQITVECITSILAFFRRNHSKYRIYNSTIAVKINEYHIHCFNFVVDCSGRRDFTILETPTLIGKVLSKNDSYIDIAERLEAYKSHDSVQEIVFISENERKIIVHRRHVNNIWTTHIYTQGWVNFESIQFSIAIDNIYDDI